jgi:hypothetical protein
MKQLLRYSMSGDEPKEHPQETMRKLGFSILGAVSHSFGDQWWFWVDIPEDAILPKYLERIPWMPIFCDMSSCDYKKICKSLTDRCPTYRGV